MLLVLPVMLVITVPEAAHSLDVDVPPCGAGRQTPPLSPLLNRVTIHSADRLLWNETPISLPQLAATRRLLVEAELQFAPAGTAEHESAARAFRAIRRTGVSNVGFVGNERFATSGR